MTSQSSSAHNPAASGGVFVNRILIVLNVILALLVLPCLFGPRLVSGPGSAAIDATKIQMHNVKTALEAFKINAGRYPTTSEGLEALVKRPSDVPENQWQTYMEAVPRDAWGYPLNYICPSEHGKAFDLVSAGPDHKLGTDDDIPTTIQNLSSNRLDVVWVF